MEVTGSDFRFANATFGITGSMTGNLVPTEANSMDHGSSVTWKRPLGPSSKALQHYREHCIAIRQGGRGGS